MGDIIIGLLFMWFAAKALKFVFGFLFPPNGGGYHADR